MSKDRMIIPFVCECCGGPLDKIKEYCPWCTVGWEMVRSYNGPDIRHYSPTGWEMRGDTILSTGFSYIGSSMSLTTCDSYGNYMPEFNRD